MMRPLSGFLDVPEEKKFCLIQAINARKPPIRTPQMSTYEKNTSKAIKKAMVMPRIKNGAICSMNLLDLVFIIIVPKGCHIVLIILKICQNARGYLLFLCVTTIPNHLADLRCYQQLKVSRYLGICYGFANPIYEH